MDLSEALGLDGPLPPTARRVIAEVHERLEGGEDPLSILREAGLSDDQVQQVEATLQHIQEASVRERGLIRAHLAINASHLTWLEEWLRSGDPAADWGIVMLPVDFSEEERWAALRRILDRMKGPPIHPQRWRANRDALVAASEDLGVRIEGLAEARAWEAVAKAVGDMTPVETRDSPDESMRRFRRHLQRLVCDDLLPDRDWSTSRNRTEPIEKAATRAVEDAAHDAALASAEIDALFDKADLSEHEAAVLSLDGKGYSNAEIGDELGRSTSAISSAKSHALQKLRDAVGRD